MKKELLTCVVAVIVTAALSACGSKAPRPDSEIALAGSALKSAELSGASKHAPIELRLAKDKQAAADKAIQEKKYARARYLSVEARVDAELARAAADAEKNRLELKRAQDNIEALRGDAIPVGNAE